MKTITVQKLKLHYFKGLKHFALETETGGQSVTIYGDNRTGKTTVADAMMWLLFNKDSLNQANFELKLLDKNGEALHGFDHYVEGVFLIDGKPLTLKKLYKELWVKRRGAANKEFTGHTTDHFVDGVPTKAKDYAEVIKSICAEDIFRLASDVRHFNQNLSWQERRKILLEVCGDITDADVIASDPALAELPARLDGKSIDDLRKILKGAQTGINKELTSIPVRIDEISASVVETRSADAVEKDITDAQAMISKYLGQIQTAKTGGGLADLQRQVMEINTQILAKENAAREVNNRAQAERDRQRRVIDMNLNKAKDAEQSARRLILQVTAEVSNGQTEISTIENNMASLRADWDTANRQKFAPPEVATTCPTCGQDIPEEQIEQALQKAQEQFNTTKAKLLETITAKGLGLKQAAEKARTAVGLVQEYLAAAQNELQDRQAEVAQREAELGQFDAEPVGFAVADTVALATQKQGLLDKIKQLEAGAAVDTAGLREQLSQAEADLAKYKAEAMQIEANKRVDARVEEHKAREKHLAALYEANESDLYLMDQFIRAKVSMLEESINSKFKMVQFKLFNENINGGLEETCITTINGVPYPSANNEARINGGIDIANTLSRHHQIAVPMVIDNAEAVVDLLPSVGQQIRLVVSGEDKELRVAA